MSALTRDDLLDVCRDIYKMAGENFMLPPLIRNVDSLDASASHTYYCLTETRCVRFVVEFDKNFVDENKFPLPRLPLRFKCELCDVDFKEPPVDLDENAKLALIRAFFLGVKAPIIAENGSLTTGFKLHIQLSPTFFVECGDLVCGDGQITSEAICHRVAENLYEKSKDFFASARDGLRVWRARAAQELFGELKPAPEMFWPGDARETAVAVYRGGQAPACPPTHAATTAVALPLTLLNPPIAASRPTLRSGLVISQERRKFFQPAAAAMMMIALAGFMGRLSFGGAISAPPERPTFVAQTSSPSVLAERAAPMESAFAPSSAIEAIQQSAEPAQPAPRMTAVVATREDAGATSAPPPAAATETAPSRADHKKFAAHRTRRRNSDPLVAVGRAANNLAAGVVKKLRRIPYQFSGLISGK